MIRRIAAVAAATLVLSPVATACIPDETPVDRSVASPLSCAGITGDNASSLGDSRATAGLLMTLSPGASSVLEFPDARMTSEVPASTTQSSPPSPIHFDLDWGTIPPDSVLIKPLRELLRKTSIEVRQSAFAVSASGAANSTVTAPSAITTSDSSLPLTLPRQTAAGTIHPTSVGTVTYRVTSIRLTIPVDASVAGVTFNTLTFDCAASVTLPTTFVPS